MILQINPQLLNLLYFASPRNIYIYTHKTISISAFFIPWIAWRITGYRKVLKLVYVYSSTHNRKPSPWGIHMAYRFSGNKPKPNEPISRLYSLQLL
jgi:hypothetical protein